MKKKSKNPDVEFYFNKADVPGSKAGKWQQEIRKLRIIILDCGLTEELKWGVPCYTYADSAAGKQESNIVLIHVFKEYCALLFFKGALLKDTHGILIQQTENVQAARQVRFTNVREITKLEPILKAYIYEAIEVERSGLKINYKKSAELPVPEELQNKLNKMPAFKTAFDALTPGGKELIFYFFQLPNNLKRGSRGSKNISRKSWKEKD